MDPIKTTNEPPQNLSQGAEASPAQTSSLTERAVQSSSDAGPTRLKPVAYASQRGNSTINLNGRVAGLMDHEGNLTRNVTCRHLAFKFATRGVSTDTGDPVKTRQIASIFSTEAGIREHFENQSLQQIDSLIESTKATGSSHSKHVLSDDRFGDYLSAVASTLESPQNREGVSHANCLLFTDTHVMAIHIEKKSKESRGGEYVAVKLYNPNVTANYKRVTVREALDLTNIRFIDILPRQASSNFAPTQKLQLSALCINDSLRPNFSRDHSELSPTRLHVAFSLGSLIDLEIMLAAELAKSEPNLDTLSAKNAKGYPGLCRVLTRGDEASVECFARAVLGSALSNDQKVSLLAATANRGVPGLYYAFAKGNTETVANFAQVVLESTLSNAQKVYLLSAKSALGGPGLLHALGLANNETVERFAQVVLGSNLSSGQKVSLLSATTATRESGLTLAAQNGRSETVNRLLHVVRNSELNRFYKDELIRQGSVGTTLGHQQRSNMA